MSVRSFEPISNQAEPVAPPGHIHVVAALIIEGQTVLMAERRDSPGVWEFPGGKLKAGESVAAGLIREIREELQIEISVLGILASFRCPTAGRDLYFTFCRASHVSGPIVLNDHTEVRWVSAEEARGLHTHPADRQIVYDLAILL